MSAIDAFDAQLAELRRLIGVARALAIPRPPTAEPPTPPAEPAPDQRATTR
jgi:hypothetical protein